MSTNATPDGDIAALRRKLATATRRAESLSRVIDSITTSSELALQPLLTRIVESAVALLDARYGSIGLVVETPQGPVVRVAAIHNMPLKEMAAEIPPGVGLAGRVLREQRPLRLDRYGDLARPTLPELAAHAVIGMPIWWAERMIGFFGLGTEPPHRFSEEDSETLALFARHAAIAIENARLFEAEQRRAARIAVINRIGRLITSSLSLDRVFQTAVEAICEQLRFAYVAAGMVASDDPEMLVLRAQAGLHASSVPPNYRQSIHEGLVGTAARTRRRVLVNDVARDPRYLALLGTPAIRAELTVPIVVNDQLLGVLNVESERPIDDDDAAGMEIIADQLGVAMINARHFADLRDALDETKLLHETAQRISTAMSVDAVVEAYLEQVAARSRYACAIVLYEVGAGGECSTRVTYGRWAPKDGMRPGRERVPYTRDALDPLLDAGETVTIADVTRDPRVPVGLRDQQLREQRPALAMIPLLVRGQRIGLVILSSPVAHEWRAADLHPYQATAAQLATAIDSRQQQLLLATRGQQLAVLEERQRLARDLHDSVTQLLFSMTLIAQSIAPAWQRGPAQGQERVNRLLELSQMTLAELRALLTELRPAGASEETKPQTPSGDDSTQPGVLRLRREGLVAALHAHVANVAREGPRITLATPGYLRQPPDLEEALFRITQEALNNVAKHAHAQSVEVRLQLADGDTAVRLSVQDDGSGFTPPVNGNASSGLGLTTMCERARALGGTAEVRAAPGQGTTVEVTVPRRDAEAPET